MEMTANEPIKRKPNCSMSWVGQGRFCSAEACFILGLLRFIVDGRVNSFHGKMRLVVLYHVTRATIQQKHNVFFFPIPGDHDVAPIRCIVTPAGGPPYLRVSGSARLSNCVSKTFSLLCGAFCPPMITTSTLHT